MYARRYEVSGETRLRLEKPQYKMNQIYFIIEGSFAVYNPSAKRKGMIENNVPFTIFKRHYVFGDYQLVFDLFPMCEFSPYVPNHNTPPHIIE